MGGLGPVDWSSFLITVAMAGERVLLPWFPIGLLMELRADRVTLRSYPSHGDQSGLDGDSDLVESLVETRGISRNRSPSERIEREPLATTNRHGNEIAFTNFSSCSHVSSFRPSSWMIRRMTRAELKK
ncbi:hypothetical protein PRIPAC_91975 [Pristionchus pacificus]|uniref:Uncharacterized protein n=1 Tax=Pristionchus pacificus TaxID=54126 RepID=A0A2A6CHG2_PRIPA|nr:hypothetical protein PRIPAC_91975 [Pristionchus pacificus]|eukprot:PDM77665.1 hypothetical protein PRIPAC_34532 [Pristionchus pacificus]